MASNSNVEIKRSPQKTHSAFHALPTLRSKERKNAEKSQSRRFHRPPQLADQFLFPGRRLDRPHRSTYSGYSGRSLDIETIISGAAGGRLNSAEVNSTIGSAKPGSGLSNGFSRSLNDVTNQPWDSMRQLPSAHSHLSLLSRGSNNKQFSASGSSRRGLGNIFPGASASLGNLSIPMNELSSNGGGKPVPSNKWQYSGIHPLIPETMRRDSTSSPDSSYSSDSASEEWPAANYVETQTVPVPVPAIKLHRQTSNASKKQINNKTQQKTSENNKKASTPQLDKILWALVPDEFANISDTGISDLEPSLQETVSSRYVTITDLESPERDENGAPISKSRVIPDAPRRPTLTQETLSHFCASVPGDDRILHWLADCEAHTLSSSLPTHLPDISYTFKFAHSHT